MKYTERIRINGQAISDEDFIRLSRDIAKPFHNIEASIADDEYQGPIGISLAIATLYFRENKTDINVIECGRGGLYDDCNILNNEYAVITSIMMEHTQNLGPNIEDIISHKLGIIKGTTRFAYISEQPEYLINIQEKMNHLNNCHVSYYGQDFWRKM